MRRSYVDAAGERRQPLLHLDALEINLIEEEDAFWWRLSSSPPMPKATQTA